MKNPLVNILIVGAGVAGKELLVELKKHFKKHYHVSGFIDDDPKKANSQILGLKVLGGTNDLGKLITKYKVSEVFIAIPSAQGETIRKIVNECQKEQVVFKIVPRLLEIVAGKVKLNQIRSVQIEDLLGRSIVKSEQERFVKEFKNKKILVTGGAGSIGSELSRQLIQFDPKVLVAYDWWENGIFDLSLEIKDLSEKDNFVGVIGSIQDYSKLEKVLTEYKPDYVFHAAAFKHVPLMQYFPEEAIKNNVFGTLNVLKACIKSNVKKFIFISSDKAAQPVNIMGATKLLGEYLVNQFNNSSKTNFSVVRFGNVLGSRGSVVPIFQKQISQGSPVTITDPNMVRYFMTTAEAVQLILQAAIMGKGGEIFILDMGEQVKIIDLARIMIKLAGFRPEIDIPIKIIGKRPGEKISEVLNSNEELLEQTSHDKINKIALNSKNNLDLDLLFKSLKLAIEQHDRKKIFGFLSTIAPNLEYFE